MIATFKNVTVEEPTGKVSNKDASKFYGTAIIKFKDESTNKKTSITIRVNTMAMLQELEKYEANETLLNIEIDILKNKFDKISDSYIFGEIENVEIIS